MSSAPEYRLIRQLARAGRWGNLDEAARFGQILPNESTRPVRRDVTDGRRVPSDGVLDCLFTPCWVLRKHLDASALRAEIAARVSDSFTGEHALSDHWQDRVWGVLLERSCGPVVSRDAYPQQTYLGRLESAVRDFVLGEWSPDWMPHFFSSLPIRPPAASPFA